MTRLSVRLVGVLALLLAFTFSGTASAAVRRQGHRPRLTLSRSERDLVRRAGSLSLAGVRAASTAANKHVRVPPKPTPTKPKQPVTVPTTPAPPAPTPVPPTPAPNVPAPATTITVDTANPGATISPAAFGSDFLAPYGGMGSADATGTFSPSFLSQLTTQVGAGSLRFPGGITAQAYQWANAVGAQSARKPNPVGPNGRPSPSTVGPDEFGQLLQQTGASGVADVNFATGTPQDAADFVAYMTAASGPMAQERAADGHAAPYNVPYWEVGNEEQTPQYWRTGTFVSYETPPTEQCPTPQACEYIYGGTTSFGIQPGQPAQPVVGGPGTGDRSPTSDTTSGTPSPNQQYEVQYPPVASPTSAAVMVNGTAWTQVPSLKSGSVSASAHDYSLDPSTGTISFGSGTVGSNAVNGGAIPATNATVTAAYESGPHDGFKQFYTAMKAANPNINVCATHTSLNFIAAMGTSLPYDCLQDHPYVGTGNISASLPIDQYESQVMAVPDVTEVAAVQSMQSATDQAAGRHVPLVLTEYGQLISSTPDPLDAPYYLNSLDEALVNASQLADWIRLGIPVADRQLLDAELPSADSSNPSYVTAGLPGAAPFSATGAITTPGPFTTGTQTIVQPTGLFLGLMKPLAGGSQLNSSVAGNPQLTTSGSTVVGDLSTVSAATSGGAQLVVINRNPTADVLSSVAFTGVGSGTATVTTLNGPSPLSDNTAAAPTTVTTSASTAAVTSGSTVIDFPAHSVTLVTLPGA